MLDTLLEAAHSEMVAYAGMIMILTAFLLETRDVLHSKERTYLVLMALGSGLLAVRAYLIDEWAFFILEVAWLAAAALAQWQLVKSFTNPKQPFGVQRTSNSMACDAWFAVAAQYRPMSRTS